MRFSPFAFRDVFGPAARNPLDFTGATGLGLEPRLQGGDLDAPCVEIGEGASVARCRSASVVSRAFERFPGFEEVEQSQPRRAGLTVGQRIAGHGRDPFRWRAISARAASPSSVSVAMRVMRPPQLGHVRSLLFAHRPRGDARNTPFAHGEFGAQRIALGIELGHGCGQLRFHTPTRTGPRASLRRGDVSSARKASRRKIPTRRSDGFRSRRPRALARSCAGTTMPRRAPDATPLRASRQNGFQVGRSGEVQIADIDTQPRSDPERMGTTMI